MADGVPLGRKALIRGESTTEAGGPEGADPGEWLFVYGSLKPGESRWPLIADLVEVVGPATAHGRIVATPMGWPAATFSGAGIVHGLLLRARGPVAARELWQVSDRLEDAGRLFIRRIIRVELDGRMQLAAAYAWNPARGAPPGKPIPGGRWQGDAG